MVRTAGKLRECRASSTSELPVTPKVNGRSLSLVIISVFVSIAVKIFGIDFSILVALFS